MMFKSGDRVVVVVDKLARFFDINYGKVLEISNFHDYWDNIPRYRVVNKDFPLSENFLLPEYCAVLEDVYNSPLYRIMNEKED